MSSIKPVAALVTGVYALALITSWHHLAESPHGHCAQHGELTHQEHDHPHSPTERRWHHGISSNPEHHHTAHGCAALSYLGLSALRAVRLVQVSCAASEPDVVCQHLRSVPPPIDVISLSPKNSPPRPA